jgi:hypothetical protein
MKEKKTWIDNHQYYEPNLHQNKFTHLCAFMNNIIVPIGRMPLVAIPFQTQLGKNVHVETFPRACTHFNMCLPKTF